MRRRPRSASGFPSCAYEAVLPVSRFGGAQTFQVRSGARRASLRHAAPDPGAKMTPGSRFRSGPRSPGSASPGLSRGRRTGIACRQRHALDAARIALLSGDEGGTVASLPKTASGQESMLPDARGRTVTSRHRPWRRLQLAGAPGPMRKPPIPGTPVLAGPRRDDPARPSLVARPAAGRLRSAAPACPCRQVLRARPFANGLTGPGEHH